MSQGSAHTLCHMYLFKPSPAFIGVVLPQRAQHMIRIGLLDFKH